MSPSTTLRHVKLTSALYLQSSAAIFGRFSRINRNPIRHFLVFCANFGTHPGLACQRFPTQKWRRTWSRRKLRLKNGVKICLLQKPLGKLKYLSSLPCLQTLLRCGRFSRILRGSNNFWKLFQACRRFPTNWSRVPKMIFTSLGNQSEEHIIDNSGCERTWNNVLFKKLLSLHKPTFVSGYKR